MTSMTLIMGLNLSTRLYLASDTRVTRTSYDQNGILTDRKLIENVLKTMPLWDKVFGPHEDDGNFLSLAVAGDVELDTFLYENLRKDLLLKNLSSDVRELYEQIEPYLTAKLEEWIIDYKKDYRGCALLFGGTSRKRRKEVNIKKLNELIETFEKSKEASLKWRPKVLAELGKEGSFMYQVNQALLRDQGKTVIEMLEESSIPQIPPHIKEALESEKSILEDHTDSLIFGVTIGLGGVIKKEKAEWGEMLAYGAIEDPKKHITDEILAIFELGGEKNVSVPHMMEGAMSSGAIMDLAKNNNIDSIGGTVTLQIMMGDSVHITGNGLVLDEEKHEIRVKIHGQDMRLFPFNTYYHMMRNSGDKGEL